MAAGASLFSDLSEYVDRVARLARLDAALLSVETKEKLQSIAVALGLFAGAIAAGFLGVVILLFAAVLLLIQLGLAPSLSALIVAVVLLAVGAILAFVGNRRLKHWSLTPRRTLAQFTSNLQALRASLRNDTNG